jgi:hypothetical protein
MSLNKDGVTTSMINFGQPRVGDIDYAHYSNSVMANQYRVVHYRDTVPHIPPTIPIPYYHTALEMYEDKDGSVRQCDGSGEDPTCADQWKPWQYSVDDHMTYLGIYMSCGVSSSEFLQ